MLLINPTHEYGVTFERAIDSVYINKTYYNINMAADIEEGIYEDFCRLV